ncbi:SAV_2336 N-terminal domain-related protein [Streptomyces bacillaris]|uniref:SAV_2336 N-terminal domain-related protein n=1 Tax=Streptomyces bacillaris TaxID=68179 RepID=UPI000DD9193E
MGGHASAPGDALTRLLRALGETRAVGGAADARTLADALWLAASGVLGEGTGPASRPPLEASEEPEPEEPERSGADALPGPAPGAVATTTSTAVSVRHRPGSGTTVRGVPLSLGRADPLPDALAVGRAVQPFRRPWLRGGRSELDVEATVEHYARGGPLVPLFRPAPEPWFEVVVLVDASLSMSVWEETTRAATRLLTALGGFRAVHAWRLEWQGTEPLVRDHHGREVPGDRVPHHGSGALGRRLVLVFSDCAARGWHAPAPWLLLRDWANRVPVALVDPLPPRLWRRSALNLPAVRVTGSRVGAHNGTLRFALPRRLGTEAGQAYAGGRSTSARGASAGGASAGDGTAGGQGASSKGASARAAFPGPWTALPVVSCTPHLLGAWASTLMRSDPAGCGAVLIPATGRLPSRTREGETPPRRPDPARLAEAFAHTAPAPAVRLAVLCSGLPDLSLPLLHVLHKEVVPEASPSDLAEVLTSGLLTVRREADSDPVLVFHPAARQYLRTHLTTHDEWRTRAAFGRHAAAHPSAPQGIAAVLHSAWAETELPAQEEPFAEVATVARAGAEAPRRTDGRSPGGGTGAVAAPGGASPVARRAVGRLRSLLGTAVSGRTVREAEELLRLLIDYTHSRLPAPAGSWPRPDTLFDDLRTADSFVRAADVADDLRRFFARRGITLLHSAGGQDPAVQNLVRPTADGPIGIRVDTPFVFSWSALTSAARSAPDRFTAHACPVEFLVSLDNSDRKDGFQDLDHCVRLTEWRGERPGVTVHIRVQTRYGRDPSHSRAAFAGELRALYNRAGSPPFSELVREADAATPPVALRSTTLHSWLTGRSVPAEAPPFDWPARYLLARADLQPPSGPTLPDDLAVPRHHALGGTARQGDRPSPERIARLGRPVRTFDRAEEELGMPRFVERLHDQALRDAVRECAAGASRMVTLVGPVGSGKSRSCMEAMRTLPSDWWLWEPGGSADLAAVLDAVPEVPPRTAIWLDPGERYLLDRSEGRRGARTAAGLRRLLHETGSGPILVLASLRPEDWSLLTAGPRPDGTHPYVLPRSLCEEGLVIRSEPDGTATLDHFRSGPPAARAFVTAALDARHYGHGAVMSEQLLIDAARGYPGDRASPFSSADLPPAVLARMGPYRLPRTTDESDGPGPVPTYYRLSESMEQYAKDPLRRPSPPDTLWDALAAHAPGSDLDRIGRTARNSGHSQQADRFRVLARSDRVRRGSLARQVRQARALRSQLQQANRTGFAVRGTADEALAWLRAEDRSSAAQYVLNGLLSCTGLPWTVTAETFRQALDWLMVHGDTPYARFVLRPLLQRADLTPEQAHRATALAFDWLRAHCTVRDAGFVLSALLGRPGLRPATVEAAGRLAIRWLGVHGTDSSARHVLRPLLERDDLGMELLVDVIAADETWGRTRPPGERADAMRARAPGKRRAEEQVAEERIVLVAEIVGDTDMQGYQISALAGVLSRVLERRERLLWDSEFSGDGMTVVLAPDQVRRTPLVPELLRDLEAELHDHAVVGRLRLRVALHRGAGVSDGWGWQGTPVTLTRRLVDSAVLRTALREAHRSPLAAVVSDSLFRSAHFGREHPLVDRFRSVYIPTKERTEKAWISVTGYEEPPGIALWTAPRPDGGAGNIAPGRPR